MYNKIIISIFVLAFFCSPILAQKDQAASIVKSDAALSTYYKRVTLVVSDIDNSLKIYRDILGFTVNSRKASTSDSFSYPVFRIPKEAKVAFATLDGPEQNRTIGLTEIKGVEFPRNDGIHMTASVIKVGDLKSCMTKIKGLGLETTKSKMANNGNFTFNEQGFVDFDGHLIVLYQILK